MAKTKQEMEKWAEAYKLVPERFWACRADGHWNIRLPNPDKDQPIIGVYRWLICQRCDRMIRQTIHRGSEVAASRTFYPEGYLVKGSGYIPRSVFRGPLIKAEDAAARKPRNVSTGTP